jgi:secreted PhoX family phosphatase
VLTGTTKNCAGGPSPWGWLSCEETDEPGHGYVFVCDPKATEAQAPQRARSFGRFKHEAAAVDPSTSIVYMTEDNTPSALYRHVPTEPSSPFVGKLEAMKLVGYDALDLGENLAVGDSFEVEWVEVEEPDAETTPTAEQAHAKGAAIVRRGEGIWYGDGAVYFVSTSGGPLAQGQIFALTLEEEGGRLTLVAQAEDDESFVNPDNVTVSPWGDLIVAEDNDGPNQVRGVTLDGKVYSLARNALNGGASEFCGVCFSPDKKVLFVNLQEPGLTLAITGPFPG